MKTFTNFLIEKALYGNDFISNFEKIISKFDGKHIKSENNVVVDEYRYGKVDITAQRDTYEVKARDCIIKIYLYSKYKFSDGTHKHTKKYCSWNYASVQLGKEIHKFPEYVPSGFDEDAIKRLNGDLEYLVTNRQNGSSEDVIKFIKKYVDLSYKHYMKYRNTK